jgi:hypothetical protein
MNLASNADSKDEVLFHSAQVPDHGLPNRDSTLRQALEKVTQVGIDTDDALVKHRDPHVGVFREQFVPAGLEIINVLLESLQLLLKLMHVRSSLRRLGSLPEDRQTIKQANLSRETMHEGRRAIG